MYVDGVGERNAFNKEMTHGNVTRVGRPEVTCFLGGSHLKMEVTFGRHTSSYHAMYIQIHGGLAQQ